MVDGTVYHYIQNFRILYFYLKLISFKSSLAYLVYFHVDLTYLLWMWISREQKIM